MREQIGEQATPERVVHYYDAVARPGGDNNVCFFQMLMDRRTGHIYAEVSLCTVSDIPTSNMLFGFLNNAWDAYREGSLKEIPDVLIINNMNIYASFAEDLIGVLKKSGQKIEVGYTLGFAAHVIEGAWRKVDQDFRLRLGFGNRKLSEAQETLGEALKKYNAEMARGEEDENPSQSTADREALENG